MNDMIRYEWWIMSHNIDLQFCIVPNNNHEWSQQDTNRLIHEDYSYQNERIDYPYQVNWMTIWTMWRSKEEQEWYHYDKKNDDCVLLWISEWALFHHF